VLSEHMGYESEPRNDNGDSGVRAIGDLCPDCGNATLVWEEGCQKCHSCGFSEC